MLLWPKIFKDEVDIFKSAIINSVIEFQKIKVHEYLRLLNDRMAKKDRVINAFQKDVQMVATVIRLRTSSLSQDRDCLARPQENPRYEVPKESSGLFYNLAYTASHEMTLDGLREHRPRGRRHRGEVYKRRPTRAANPPMVTTPKVPQMKVEMVLEQLVLSPFTDAIKNARPLKNFTLPKFNQYDPKTGDAIAHLIHYQQMMSFHHADDPLMCKMFPSSFGTLGLLWFNKLPCKSVPDYKALSALFLQRFVKSQKIEKDIDSLLSLKKTGEVTLWYYANRNWDMFNEMEGCVQYQKVAVSSFKNGLYESAKEAYQDFYLHPPKDMDDLMVHIDHHCQMTEDMAARWKATGGLGKTELGRGGRVVYNIQKGKGKD
ncbi:hypothetical protein RHSIM_Rhsim13G0105900 [Rhododendron simsii]|uniref:Retrotransposon gag domain-containing protein n=1 Tax=Rhododendron simsii TaxID=118357 RepID=A0A834L6H7_RHOSS|nr:hypothetical protein RHSIM_Rhsim13G0105900 [Rhododendron simsii]